MNYREVELLFRESIATAGTKTIDLGVQNPVSRIDVIWKKTNSNRTPIAHPGKIVSSIEVVDGSDVLFSMNGQDAQALDYFTTRMQPASMINYETGQWSMQIASIYFGRYLWDKILELDPKRFNNIQIKVQHNLDLGGATGTVADLSIYAHVFDDMVIEPRGFLLSKEQYSFLPVANSWYYIDLPTDYPIRALMFGANECEDGPEYNLDEFKITENEGKSVIVDSEMERYLLVQSQHYDPWMEKVIFKVAGADTDLDFYASPHWERSFVGVCADASGYLDYHSAAGCLYDVACNAVNLVEGWAQGHAPFGQIFVPFGPLDTVDEYWDIQRSASGKLSIQAGAGPDTDEYVRAYVQQVRSY